MPTSTPAISLDRPSILERFTRSRSRTRALFDLLEDEAYYARPIPLRNPVVFYEGHVPAFAVNTLVKRGLGRSGVDEELEAIFARGIDPESEASAVARGNPAWPSRQVVRKYVEEADRLIADALGNAELERPGHPLLDRAEAVWVILEHEEMHQETLAYMWHQLPHAHKRKPPHYVTTPPTMSQAPTPSTALVRGGRVTLGTDPEVDGFGWDNERPRHEVSVDSFAIGSWKVTNGEFLEFVESGGYKNPRWWRPEDWKWLENEAIVHPPFWRQSESGWAWLGMFESVPLPMAWPVYVTWAEARAFAEWRGQRLPTEAEFHRAAYGQPSASERRYPWGDQLSTPVPANFDFRRWDPLPVHSAPGATSAWGVHELVGNGWEWTADVFGPFDGFTAMPAYPEYSADFFDQRHFVLKGASPVTPRELVRRGFRNWFRPRYPYAYAAFRCARSS